MRISFALVVKTDQQRCLGRHGSRSGGLMMFPVHMLMIMTAELLILLASPPLFCVDHVYTMGLMAPRTLTQ